MQSASASRPWASAYERWRPYVVVFAAYVAGLSAALALVHTAGRRVHLSPPWYVPVFAVLIGGAAFGYMTAPSIRRRIPRALFSVAVVGGAALAARSSTYAFAILVSAFCAGAAPALLSGAVGTITAQSRVRQRQMLFLVVVLGITVFAPTFSPAPSLMVPIALVAATVAAMLGPFEPGPLSHRRLWAVPLWLGVTAGTLGFVGATNPRATWLGPVTSSGPSSAPRVALTFDDGPNGETTLAVMRALDERGVKGTFFLVGKAVEQEPEVANRIIADGHLAGNHSYSHDGWRYIQPAYPELERGRAAFRSATGLCPRFYRPPHGTHTPFVALAAHQHDERVVNWDVSAQDWIATDPDELARRIVEQSRPGSIILLHDGIDGIPGADRSVVIAALPAIIDGLRAKGLEPVRLDELLGDRAYGEC